MPTHYEILGVLKDASLEEIKRAHKKLSLEYHPDLTGGTTEEKMKLINQAYQVLSDPKARVINDIKLKERKKEAYTYVVQNVPRIEASGKKALNDYQRHHKLLERQYKPSKKLRDFEPILASYRRQPIYQYNNKQHSAIYYLIDAKKKNGEICKLDFDLYSDINESVLTEIFTRFLAGDLFGSILDRLNEKLSKKIRSLRSSGAKSLDYFEVVLDLLSVEIGSSNIVVTVLKSLDKLTKYLEKNSQNLTEEQILLFSSQEYKALFQLTTEIYWLRVNLEKKSFVEYYPIYLQEYSSELEHEDDFMLGLFSGVDECFEELKSLRISVDDKDKKILLFDQLMSFEQNISRKIISEKTAEGLRELAFDIILSQSYLEKDKLINNRIFLNMLLQAGACFVSAAARETNQATKFADEILAFNLFEKAINMAHLSDNQTELYALNNSIRYLLNVKLACNEVYDKLESYVRRFRQITSIYPFFYIAGSCTSLYKAEMPQIELRKAYLQKSYNNCKNELIVQQARPSNEDLIDILYEMYVCALHGYYDFNTSSEAFYKIRDELLQALSFADSQLYGRVGDNINAPSVMVSRDFDGWLKPPPQSIPIPSGVEFQKVQSLDNILFSNGNGTITISLKLADENKPETALLTIFDIVDIFNRDITEARFSLDEFDPTRPLHPFYKMTYTPASLEGTDFLKTLCMTDYLLKFFTIGQEVNPRAGYRLRSISHLIDPLPPHLKKVIQDYHSGERSLFNTHRFWIETEDAETVFNQWGREHRVTIGDVRMVVKKHALTRNVQGNLVDNEEDKEGWDIYIVDPNTEGSIFTRAIRFVDTKILKWPNEVAFDTGYIRRFMRGKAKDRPAIIIHHQRDEVYFVESWSISRKYDLSDISEVLQGLRELPREKNNLVKFNDQPYAVRAKVYEHTLAICERKSRKHHFSREYIFTHEFTKYYEEFGRYFPEFLRLRELSKVCLYIKFLHQAHNRIKDREMGDNILYDFVNAHVKMNRSFKKLGLGTITRESESSVGLVPASLNSQTTNGMYFSYGGVRVQPRAFPLHGRVKYASEQFKATTSNGRTYGCNQDEFEKARKSAERRNPVYSERVKEHPARMARELEEKRYKMWAENPLPKRESKFFKPAAAASAGASGASAAAGGSAAGAGTGGSAAGTSGGGRTGGSSASPKKPAQCSDTSARNAADGVRHRAELALKQHNILDVNGKLTKNAISEAIILIDGNDLKNEEVKQALTKDGSNIKDWAKMTTKAIKLSSSQRIEVHFYKNQLTGEVNYTHRDYKVKGFIDPTYEQCYKKQHDEQVRKFVPTYK